MDGVGDGLDLTVIALHIEIRIGAVDITAGEITITDARGTTTAITTAQHPAETGLITDRDSLQAEHRVLETIFIPTSAE